MKVDEKRIGMLRQWLNEDRKCTPLITNKEIKFWLTGEPQDCTPHEWNISPRKTNNLIELYMKCSNCGKEK